MAQGEGGRKGQLEAQSKADPKTIEGAKAKTGANSKKSDTQVSAKQLEEFIYTDPKKGGNNPINVYKLLDLKYAFLIGSTTVEACRYAGITEQGYRLWVKNMPDDDMKQRWLELVGKWQDDVVLQARHTIRQHVNRPDTAKWLLERKRRDEYATRVENENKVVEKWDDVGDEVLEDMIGSSMTEGDEEDDAGGSK